jgi:transcription-repair coupling factor (superfamily II helicase)
LDDVAALREAFRALGFARAAADAFAPGGARPPARSFTVGGLVGGAPALLLAALDGDLPSPRLVVCAGPDDAALLREDLAEFLGPGRSGEVALFPAFDTFQADHRVRESGKLGERTAVVEGLAAAGGPRYVVASLGALLQPVPPPDALRAGRIALRVGERLVLDDLQRRLAEAGFSRMALVEAPGEWSLRGGILDVFPRGRDLPIRIELFGDEIDSLRVFDPASQRSLQNLKQADVPLLSATSAVGEALPADAEERARAVRRAVLLPDLLPHGAMVVHVDEEGAARWLQRFERARPEEELGTLYARFTLRCLDRPNLRLASQPAARAEGAVTARLLTATGLARDLVTFRAALDALLERNDRVALYCATEGEATRVRHFLAEARFEADSGAHGRLEIRTGRLSRGFQVPELRTALLSYDELFGRTRLPRPQEAARATEAAPAWADLRPGDTVVHLDHGIGVYRGLEILEKDGQRTENLALEFDGGIRLYVPVTKAALVHRYVGAGEAAPKLSKIGGREWEARKVAVAQATEGIARELLRTQAMRKARPGVAFPPDGPEQVEFEATFPYELTPDQRNALAAIKRDLEADTPMDRLLCGDVGFGKTELAVRAAFKCVMAGRQVAVLVPTTVLAEQHGKVFADRYASYPVTVAVLSRFRTEREQRAILEGVREGKVDVVIGTHRLVQGDVEFRNLGLLVIDEEQRFGVKAKEALRLARATVDVITLTATPIPRTLHMALLGLRDISSLTTPPFGRRAIETEVIAPDDAVVRDGLLRELERGGQAFVIHNRVQTIDRVAARLRHTVPEARFAVVHGQMADHEIEERMVEFVEGRADVLVATTIVESGLDIPNANTIFIDEAHHLGLADLHQLRGRVGRYDRRAYCYLIVPTGPLATDAERRVRAIEELSDLGAGFRIAMRDLEIRGAGNLLGAEQSGHIAAVGYELYCQLLADAVHRMRQDDPRDRTSCHVALGVTAEIPPAYVADDRQRIEIYRRLSSAMEETAVSEFVAELRDRFGELPAEVRLLVGLAQVRIRAEKLGITRLVSIVHDGEDRVLLRTPHPQVVRYALRRLGSSLRVVDGNHCHLLYPRPGIEGEARIASVLEALSAADLRPPPSRGPAGGPRPGGGNRELRRRDGAK